MSHWQSVLTSSAFGTRSNSIGSITLPAQWHMAVHYHRVRRGKMATDDRQVHLPPSRRRGPRRRPRPLRIKQPAPNTEGAEAVAIAHPSCTSNSSGTDAFGAGTGEEVGRSAQFDATICAPKRHNFRLRHGKSTRNGEGRNRSCRSARRCAPHNDPHKLPKPPSVGSAAEPPSGGSNCTASWRLHLAPSESHVSRGSHHSVARPARVGGFAA
jgi:hypothetical protein